MPRIARLSILVAHQDPLIAAGLGVTLGKCPDFEVAVCEPASPAMNIVTLHLHSADIVLADYDSGLRLTRSAQAKDNRVVLLTHRQSEVEIWEALERGVRGYLLLGCSLEDLIDSLQLVHGGHIALAPLVASRMEDRKTRQVLTRREVEILRQMTLGLSNKAIARELTVAAETVKSHIKSILNKLDARNRTEAVAIAQRRGLLGKDSGSTPPPRIGFDASSTFQRDYRRGMATCLEGPGVAPLHR